MNHIIIQAGKTRRFFSLKARSVSVMNKCFRELSNDGFAASQFRVLHSSFGNEENIVCMPHHSLAFARLGLVTSCFSIAVMKIRKFISNRKSNSINESEDSYEITKYRFSRPESAKKYSQRHIKSRKHFQEIKCITEALEGCDKSLLLDLPCGTGRLSYYFKRLGYKVVGADCSEHMIQYAQKRSIEETGKPFDDKDDSLRFECQEVLNIHYPDNTFSVTVCNRLFHHYSDSKTRRKALKELSRVTDGPLIVSFFSLFSLYTLKYYIKHYLENIPPTDRIPLSIQILQEDVESCGLKIDRILPVSYGISPQTYVKLIKQ
jgi:ubiquinone/menaquinone biosynthesis C-methylase UbiE